MGAFLGKTEREKLSARSGWTVYLTRSGNMRILDIYAYNTTCDSTGNFKCGITLKEGDRPLHDIEVPAFFDVVGNVGFFSTRVCVGTAGSVTCALRGTLPGTSGTFSTQLVWAVEEV